MHSKSIHSGLNFMLKDGNEGERDRVDFDYHFKLDRFLDF